MSESVLSDTLLEACAQRAAGYDRENRFFTEDLADLRNSGYLLAAVPREFGGLGLTFSQVCQEQRRLARRSAPTALGINMHLGATGMAADLYGRGDRSQAWILEEARQGAIFAYGYSDSSNDLEVLYATTKAERVDGGYRFYGHRHFGSLSPVWNWLHTYGVDTSDPDDPKMVFGVIARDAPGYRIVENWDTLGMRATQSHDTILEGVFVPDRHIIRIAKPGFAGADQFILTLFGRFEPQFANIYVGLAERAHRSDDRAGQKEDLGRHERPLDGPSSRSAAHHRADVHRTGGHGRARRSYRTGLDERCRPRRPLAGEAGCREISLCRRRVKVWPIWHWMYPAGAACSGATNSSASIATRAAVASTRRTRWWCTR